MEKTKITISWIPTFTLILFGITCILFQYYVNETLGEIYFGWGILGAMLVSGNDLSRKSVFWIMLPIIFWAYMCIGVHLIFEHPSTWKKRLMVIYRRK